MTIGLVEVIAGSGATGPSNAFSASAAIGDALLAAVLLRADGL
jgi:hypothetical protein